MIMMKKYKRSQSLDHFKLNNQTASCVKEMLCRGSLGSVWPVFVHKFIWALSDRETASV